LTGKIWTAYAQSGARLFATVHLAETDQNQTQHSGRGGRRFSRDRARQGRAATTVDVDELGVRLQMGQSRNITLCPGKFFAVIELFLY